MNREEYIITTVIAVLLLFTGWTFILSVRHPSSIPPTQNDEETILPPSPVIQRSFILLQPFELSVQAGQTWSASFETNALQPCRLEAYRPNGTLAEISSLQLSLQHSSEHAQVSIIRWDIPLNTQSGLWTVRLLCGTNDNLATSNIAVTIN